MFRAPWLLVSRSQLTALTKPTMVAVSTHLPFSTIIMVLQWGNTSSEYHQVDVHGWTEQSVSFFSISLSELNHHRTPNKVCSVPSTSFSSLTNVVFSVESFHHLSPPTVTNINLGTVRSQPHGHHPQSTPSAQLTCVIMHRSFCRLHCAFTQYW